MVFNFLISRTAESKSLTYRKELISTLRPDVINKLSRFSSVDDIVESWAMTNKKKISSKTRLLLARLVATDIHRIVDKEIAANFKALQNMPAATRKAEYLILHRYTWGETLADLVRAQCWGNIGQDRKRWLESDDQGQTARFGIESEYERRVVGGDSPLYVVVESTSERIDAKLLKIVEF